ncbi:tRNA (guanine(9)-N(1))-methyltransferase [Xylographa opegraphella]|nr:tRNA (guanine(9)-N(1))-methyltransferase [Xylographa opegraphella]
MEAEERPRKMRRLSGEFCGADREEKAARADDGTALDLNQALKTDTVGVHDLDAQAVDLEALGSKVVESAASGSSPHMKAQVLSNATENKPQSIDENVSEKIDTGIIDDEKGENGTTGSAPTVPSDLQPDEPVTGSQLSKNQMKKLKRKQEWEAGREYRKVRRKEKIQEKKQRKRAALKEEEPTDGTAVSQSASENKKPVKAAQEPAKRALLRSVRLPITVVVDCGFDDLMLDNERVSLASQLTRCYSDNHHAPFQFHMAVSSFGRKLKERFETVLSGHHQSWRGVRFLDGDFVEAAEQAKEWMVGPQGGVLAGVFKGKASGEVGAEKVVDTGEAETIYLTSDSPDTLTELKPYSTYIIGGLVDRNRHKGICYKRAMDRGMKTARLPIGEYMDMASRFVLATNHVSEIMVRWLELGDWGEAFLKVVPKRKGGVLKGAGVVGGEGNGEEGEAGDGVVPGIESKQDG